MTNTEAANVAISAGRFGLKYAHERLFDMFSTDVISGPLKRPVQLTGREGGVGQQGANANNGVASSI
ncbi:hypothetical protein [Pseudomonas synxantha]|uniref:Uncharacterized protein n=1 Tax=Pseudomonas synxantha TaxID=47883 RepID=A0A5D3GA10_9PSED|nr:hypothetical protein [Pseudomonas synxantha]TYK57897.1 hypothetical protein FXO26_11605 [Pseudomonas synxantha]